LDDYRARVASGRLHAHPALVLAVVGRNVGQQVDDVVAQHLFATVVSLTQNAVRGIPLGQNAGQRVQGMARTWVLTAVERSARLTREDLGAISPGLEIAQMQHERQRARLFMS
ncbi:MAG: urease accessory UreF family protein, partial [Luteococcus japonicus]